MTSLKNVLTVSALPGAETDSREAWPNAYAPTVGIVVLSWKRFDRVRACLESLSLLEYPNVSALVVANGTDDETANLIRSTFPDVEVIETGANLGYAQGNNVGINCLVGRGVNYILILNDDVTIAPDMVSHLVFAAESNPNAAFLGPKIYHTEFPSRIQSAGAMLDYLWRSKQRGLDEIEREQYYQVSRVDYVIGAAIIARVEAIKHIGVLDPDFFMYREDVDWALRAKDAGYRVLYVPEALAWHRGHNARHTELPRITYYMTRNSLLLMSKHRAGFARTAAFLMRVLVTYISWTIRPRWRHKSDERDALLLGVRHFFEGKLGKGFN